MRDPYFWNSDPACRGVYFNFDYCCRIRICWRRSHAAAFVQCGRLRRSVGAHGSNRAETSFGQANRFLERDALFRRSGIEHAPVSKAQPFSWHCEFFRDRFCEQSFTAFGRLQGRVAGHQRDAAGVRAKVDWSEVRITREQADVKRVDTENFGDNSGEGLNRGLVLVLIRRGTGEGSPVSK